MSERIRLDPARIRELFDLRRAKLGGDFDEDPYPIWHRLRDTGPVHEGTPGRLSGYQGDETFFGLPEPDRRHFTAFDFETCDTVVRTPDVFKSSPPDPSGDVALHELSMLTMDGEKHRRYRALVQPSFSPQRMAWWRDNWVDPTVEALIDSIEADGSADLNIQFFAAIPILTICGSFGISVEDTLDIRVAVTSGGRTGLDRFMEILKPIVAARRKEPQDDLISVLCGARIEDEAGAHELTDADILSFSFLLLAAGSGTTWKQMGITMVAMFQHPKWLDAARDDPSLLDAIVEEAARWMPTDPAFGRFTHAPVTLAGVDIPVGSVVHPNFGAASRDPKRWDRPDEFDPGRTLRASMAFGRGAHVCMGKNLARTEIVVAIRRLLERLPNLRLDPDAEAPRYIGMYERGITAVPAVWG